MTKKTKQFKIFIMGISGDYAQRKVLPSIGQFLSHYGDKVNFEILGYSRSKVEQKIVRDIVSKYTNCDFEVKLETGSYEDLSFFQQELSKLGENQRLVCYLALPPSVYLGFLESLSKIESKNFSILIEKPFGRSKDEATKISQTIVDNNLYNNIFFVDHYLFKPGSRIPLKSLFDRYNLQFGDLKKVKIRALEELGVEGRIGYYNKTGAFKDMFPHLYSLYILGLESLGINLAASSIKIVNHETKIYDGYKDEILKLDPSTEVFANTYFMTTAEAYYPNKKIELVFESGKKQGEKLTDASFVFDNYVINLNLAPANYLTICKKTSNNSHKVVETVPVLDTFFGDHERMFKDILENNYNYFVKADKIIEYWDLINEIES